MALRLLVYRLLDGGLATCLESTDKQGAVVRQQWMGYSGDNQPEHLDGPPANRIGPLRVIDISDDDID